MGIIVWATEVPEHEGELGRVHCAHSPRGSYGRPKVEATVGWGGRPSITVEAEVQTIQPKGFHPKKLSIELTGVTLWNLVEQLARHDEVAKLFKDEFLPGLRRRAERD